jgi:heterodisulfide reductase subunit C
MKNFGYTINHDRQIDYDALPKDIYEKLKKMEPSVKACISCGTCSATCTAGQFTDFSLRKYIILLRRGNYQEVVRNIHKCMLCGKCTQVCPMGVNTRNIIRIIQSLN